MKTTGKDPTTEFIMEFVEEWITPLEQLAQEVFLGQEFKKEVAANRTEEFWRNETVIKRALQKLNNRKSVV